MGLFFVFHILYSLFFPSKCFVQMSYCFLVSFDFVSSFHFGHDVVEVDACVFPEDEEVVEEVAGFGGDFFFVFVLVGDDDFAGFFSDFLVDFVAAFGKEVVRVGFGLGIFLSVFDFLAEGVEDGKGPFCFLVRKSLDAAEEAGAVSRVAGGAFGEDGLRWCLRRSRCKGARCAGCGRILRLCARVSGGSGCSTRFLLLRGSFVKDSSFIHAIMRISPLLASWTMAGMRPFSLKCMFSGLTFSMCTSILPGGWGCLLLPGIF